VISGVLWQPQRTAVETGAEAATAEASRESKPGMALIGTVTTRGDKLPLFLATHGKRKRSITHLDHYQLRTRMGKSRWVLRIHAIHSQLTRRRPCCVGWALVRAVAGSLASEGFRAQWDNLGDDDAFCGIEFGHENVDHNDITTPEQQVSFLIEEPKDANVSE
jgi:hypothetical protein